jgi:adenylate kinase
MRLVLFGPPGAGKGTQSRFLVEHYGLKQISTGDLFRAALANDTPVGREARAFMDRGALVPDEVVSRMVAEALTEIDCRDFVLDGFPRTIPQAEWLVGFLTDANAPLDAVLSLRVDPDVIVQRLSRRRMDPNTGAIYHLDFNPPPAGVDADALVRRDDDQPDAIRNRLKVYEMETLPVVATLEDHTTVVAIDGEGAIDEVQRRIALALEGARASAQS